MERLRNLTNFIKIYVVYSQNKKLPEFYLLGVKHELYSYSNYRFIL